MLVPPHAVNRVIARPFVGEPGGFARTSNRRDYAIPPPPNLLDRLAAAGVPIHAVGKIGDIYCGRGVMSSVRVTDNSDTVNKTVDLMERTEHGLVFVNLNDFDSKFGHRRNVRGYAAALEALDAAIPRVLQTLRPGDEVLFTADHGCDPSAPGSDHTREFVPYIHLGGKQRGALGILQGLDAVGRAIQAALLGEREGARTA
jgi:phosphopentomutase